MADAQTIKDLATLSLEVFHLKEALIESESACKLRDEQAITRIRALEEYKARTEKYGFFLMGMAAVGTMLAAGFEKVVNKIMGVIP